MRKTVYKIAFFVAAVSIIGIVEYVILHKKRENSHITLYGNVDVRLVDISFRVSGRVKELFFEEGDMVCKGQLLAVLDHTPYDSRLEEAQANLAAINAQLSNAATLLVRRKELVEVGGVSQEDLDNAQTNYDQLFANALQAQANVKVQEDNMSYTEVYAPTDGVILTRIREPGSVIVESEPVYTLSVTSPVWIRAFVEEKELGNIYFGMPADIYTDTKDGAVYHGKIGFISPMAEFTPKTVQTAELRTDLVYRLRIYADNPDWRLKQGMPVTVKLKKE